MKSFHINFGPTDEEEGELVIVEDVSENDVEVDAHKNRYFCLPCKSNFAKQDEYFNHISR